MAVQYGQVTPDLAGIPMGSSTQETTPVPQLLNLLQNIPVPPGFIMAFAASTAPVGYLALPGSPTNLSRLAYPDLFAAIGTTWGAGDGVTTFGMPYIPGDYTVLHSGSPGTTSVGQVISHSHVEYADNGSVGTTNGVQQNTTANPAPGTATSYSTGATGGSQNLAAGARYTYCVKY